MINIKTGIGFNFIMNNTKLEWHDLQHHLKEWVGKQTLHCIPKAFGKEPEFSAAPMDEYRIDFYVRLNVERLRIEVICLEVEEIGFVATTTN
jgi:hypothetical protein